MSAIIATAPIAIPAIGPPPSKFELGVPDVCAAEVPVVLTESVVDVEELSVIEDVLEVALVVEAVRELEYAASRTCGSSAKIVLSDGVLQVGTPCSFTPQQCQSSSVDLYPTSECGIPARRCQQE